MEDPDACQHDFRRLYPRHVTGQVKTDPDEQVLAVLCCRCGCSPLRFMRNQEWREIRRGNAGAFEEWPESLRVTDYEWASGAGGPRVKFVSEPREESS